jgi:preprotein translocase subunit YajC
MLFALLLAETAPSQPASNDPGAWFPIVMVGLPILAILYFGMILPMKRQEKQRKNLIATLKRNDRVVNQGGIIGVVESVKDKEDEVVLKGGLRITLTSIVRVIPEDAGKEQKTGGA